jgi:hypothetical protein
VSRRAGAAALALVILCAAALLGAGPASAAPQLQLSPASGPAGTTVTVAAAGFAAGDVELRWGTQSGPLLATAVGPDFTVPVVVPDAGPDTYPLVAVARSANGVSTSSASFQVTPGQAPAPTTVTPAPRGRSTVEAPARGDGVAGGLDPGMADTTDGAGQAPAGAGPATAVTTTAVAPTVAAGASPTTTQAVAVAAAASTPSSAVTGDAPSGSPDAGAAAGGRALGATSAGAEAGGVRWPGLALIAAGAALGGAALVSVRNRRRPAA